MSQKLNTAIAVIGIDIGKNSFHVVGHDERGAIVLRQKWSSGQVEAQLANMPPYQIGLFEDPLHHLRTDGWTGEFDSELASCVIPRCRSSFDITGVPVSKRTR